MEAHILFSQGTEEIVEDQTFFRLPFLGVIDGLSSPFLPSEGPRRFSGQTGGQLVTDAIHLAFASAQRGDSLSTIVRRANGQVRLIQASCGISIERSDLLSGAAFAVAKIREKTVEILQAADCLAFWQLCDGTIGATPNQVFSHDMELRSITARLMERHREDREKMRRDLAPVLARMRFEHVNAQVEDGYGVLNGQRELEDCWQRVSLPRHNLSVLLLCTDGLIHYPESGDEKNLAKGILDTFQRDGLEDILTRTRILEAQEKKVSHIDHAEASAIAIEF